MEFGSRGQRSHRQGIQLTMRTKQEKEYFLDEEPEYSQGDGARRDEETNAVLDELVFVRLNSRSDVVQVFVQLCLYRLHGVIRGLEGVQSRV